MIEGNIFKDLSSQLGKIASAIQEAFANRINFSNLYEEVMKIEGFEEFDNLNGNEVLASLFEK